MKILMLLDNQFPPDIRVEKEANSLLSAGNEVAILSYNYYGLDKEEYINGIRIFRFNIPLQVAKKILGLSLRLPVYRWVWQHAISEFASQYDFDVIHIHDLPLCTLINYIKEVYGVPVIADMHENYPYLVAEQPYMNSLFAKIFLSREKWFEKEKEWLVKADAIICVAEEMKQRIESVIKSDIPISVVPNTPAIPELDASMTGYAGIKKRFTGTFNILYLGGIDPVRGIDILLNAAAIARIQIPGMRIIIVGEGKILPEMKLIADSLKLDDTVFFEGWKPAEEIGSYISVSDVCVIPHRKSPQTDNSSPNKLFQYLFFKRPVIASDCNSVEKLIHAEKCGLIYKDSSPEELASALNDLYENPVTGIEMGNNGYQSVIKKYNWDITVAPLIALYSKLNQ